MNAMDTALAMGASEGQRTGYVMSRPEQAGRCMSIIGDSTECHSGMDATRNAVYRNVPGVKVILDNEWTAMTGGQPSPTSPANLAGSPSASTCRRPCPPTAPRWPWLAPTTASSSARP